MECLNEMLARNVRMLPDRPFIIADEETLTYAEFDRRTKKIGSALSACGVKKGDCVGLYLPSGLTMALGFWAYRENYRTQAELADVRALQSEIADLREGLSVLNAEWAYLNRPDRLRELADLNFERLGLLPLEPEQFGDVAQIIYPSVETPLLDPVTDPISTVAALDQTP